MNRGLDRAEDEFLDVLQNLEMGVFACFKEDPRLTDWDVQAAYEAMVRAVRARADGLPPPEARLNEPAQVVYNELAGIVAWRLGEPDMQDRRGRPMPQAKIIEPADMVTCLKRLLRSLKLWNKQGGRQGYLNYIVQFLGG